jgi:hypothetical protein
MHVEFAQQAREWGGWVFGDLTAAGCRAVEVLGPSADVLTVTASRPGGGLPRVLLVVPDALEVARLRREAESGEYPLRHIGNADDRGWEVEVNRVRLVVAVAEEES